MERDVAPGEAIFIDMDGKFYSSSAPSSEPGADALYLRVRVPGPPDSCIDGVPVYDARLRMGDYLAEKICRGVSSGDIDVVMPIPDSSRPAAMQVASNSLGVDYRVGFSAPASSTW